MEKELKKMLEQSKQLVHHIRNEETGLPYCGIFARAPEYWEKHRQIMLGDNRLCNCPACLEICIPIIEERKAVLRTMLSHCREI